jgi:hypothetical protein
VRHISISNVSKSVDGFRHLTKNNSASSMALSVFGGGQSKFIIKQASSGLRMVFNAESFVEILLVISHPLVHGILEDIYVNIYQ